MINDNVTLETKILTGLLKTEISDLRKSRTIKTIIEPMKLALTNNVIIADADFTNFPKLENLLGYYRIDVTEEGKYEHSIVFRKDIKKKYKRFTIAHLLGYYFMYKNGVLELPDDFELPGESIIIATYPYDGKQLSCYHFADNKDPKIQKKKFNRINEFV